MLILNNKQFFAGKGDSAEIWFRTKPTHSLPEILAQIEDSGLVFAAHPEKKVPLLQRLFLGRGKWYLPDYQHERLNGLQILNGVIEDAFFDGLAIWRNLLLTGKKLTLVAGTDAHGNFNRYRQVSLPGLMLEESEVHRFASTRTSVYVYDPMNRDTVLAALKKGRSIITNGPAHSIELLDSNNHWLIAGDVLCNSSVTIRLTGKTTPEFGTFTLLRCFVGDLKKKKEICYYEQMKFLRQDTFQKDLGDVELPRNGYIRSELWTQNSGRLYFAITNPIWIEHPE